VKDIYETYIDNAFGDHKQADFKFSDYEHNYKRYFPPDKAAKLLDIGIGRGEMLSCMKEWGYANYLGVDISTSTISFCTSLGLNCILVKDTLQWLSDKEAFYDMITLLDVLEHFKKEDVIPFLKSLYKALAPNGIIIIQVPNLQSPDSQLHRYNDFTHEIGFVEHSLSQVIKAASIPHYVILGYEELYKFNTKTIIKYSLRKVYWMFCRFLRKINTNLNPLILNPVFFAVISKKE
jgi:2-polyprenyl-3-methyl-5-hydroxy-6-metoxy-1,4-benzoquinol methylase